MKSASLWAVFIVYGAIAPAIAAVPEALVQNEEMLKIRDPFKRPNMVEEKTVPLTELERSPVEDFRMVGMITGPDRLRAMVRGPDGKTYFVSEKMRIGVRKGIVTRITPKAIYVREQIVNVLGQEEPVDTEIKMVSKKGNSG